MIEAEIDTNNHNSLHWKIPNIKISLMKIELIVIEAPNNHQQIRVSWIRLVDTICSV